MMESMFKDWLLKRGNKGAASSYPRAIYQISEHYSAQTDENIEIYKIKDQGKISAIAHDYSQTGRFSEFGYEQHGRYRAAIGRYSDFFVESRGEDFDSTQLIAHDVEDLGTEPANNFAYEKDLQTSLCSHISELFPDHHIFGGLGIGVEYSIGGRRIDVLLEHNVEDSLLVIELKSGEADFKVFGQISMYIGLLQRQFPERVVSGVIVAGCIEESLIQACEITDKVKLKTYQMNIELEDA